MLRGLVVQAVYQGRENLHLLRDVQPRDAHPQVDDGEILRGWRVSGLNMQVIFIP
jgi:hypothetical protein